MMELHDFVMRVPDTRRTQPTSEVTVAKSSSTTGGCDPAVTFNCGECFVSSPDLRPVADRLDQGDRLSPTIGELLLVPAGGAEVRLVIEIGTMFARGPSARPARVHVASTQEKG